GAADVVIAGDDVERDAADERRAALVRGDVAVPVEHPHVAIVAVRAGDVHVVAGVEREIGRRQRRLSWQGEGGDVEHRVDDPRFVVRDQRRGRARDVRVVTPLTPYPERAIPVAPPGMAWPDHTA